MCVVDVLRGLPSDECPSHRKLKMSLEFWKDVQTKAKNWKVIIVKSMRIDKSSEVERSCRELRTKS